MKIELHDGRTLTIGGEESEEQPATPFTPAPQPDVRLEDLPADARTMTVVCAVLAYKVIGIRDVDIAIALGCSEEELQGIIDSDAYARTYNMMINSFVTGQQNAARDVIASNAVHAARELVKTMKSSKSESNRLRASEGVLNRAGVSDVKADHDMNEGLVIRVVQDAKTNISIKVR